ncbi:hypothetical protein PMAYCL1PPCAC_04339, partial [Pristionchus mayeri]
SSTPIVLRVFDTKKKAGNGSTGYSGRRYRGRSDDLSGCDLLRNLLGDAGVLLHCDGGEADEGRDVGWASDDAESQTSLLFAHSLRSDHATFFSLCHHHGEQEISVAQWYEIPVTVIGMHGHITL